MVYFFTNTVNSRTLWEVDDENRRKKSRFWYSGYIGKKYACIYRNTTLKLFQYCQETDIYERLDEYLRPVKNITDFKTSGQKYSNVYKDDWKYLTDFLTSREGGTIEVRCINKDGNASLLTVRGFIAQDQKYRISLFHRKLQRYHQGEAAGRISWGTCPERSSDRSV